MGRIKAQPANMADQTFCVPSYLPCTVPLFGLSVIWDNVMRWQAKNTPFRPKKTARLDVESHLACKAHTFPISVWHSANRIINIIRGIIYVAHVPSVCCTHCLCGIGPEARGDDERRRWDGRGGGGLTSIKIHAKGVLESLYHAISTVCRIDSQTKSLTCHVIRCDVLHTSTKCESANFFQSTSPYR